jgi:hypothetical protein
MAPQQTLQHIKMSRNVYRDRIFVSPTHTAGSTIGRITYVLRNMFYVSVTIET